jgi:hypothetical protein
MLKQRTLLDGYSREIGVITESDAANDPAPLDFAAQRPPRLASVICAVCNTPCRIPILANGKLCDLCRADLVLAESNIKADLAAAEAAHDASMDALDAALGQADDDTLERYRVAVEARESGQQHELVMKRWQKALDENNARAPLFRAYDARLAAARALSAAYRRTKHALGEIEAAR